MKKNKTRVVSLLLCLTMLFSLAACGNESGGAEPAVTPEPEYVYAAEFSKPVTGAEGNVNVAATTENGYYEFRSVMLSNEIPEGVTPEWENQYAVYGTEIWFVDFAGKETKLEGYVDRTFEPTHEGAEGGTYLNRLFPAADGTIYAVGDKYEYWSEAPAGVEQYSDEWYQYYANEEVYFVLHLAADGSEIGYAELDMSQLDGPYLSTYAGVITDDGTLICGADSYVAVFQANGEMAAKIPAKNWVDGVYRLKDGSIAVMDYGERGQALYKLDLKNNQYGEEIELPTNCWSILIGGGAYDFYYTNGNNFYGYSIEYKESTKLFDWISCDINPNDVNNYFVNDDGSVSGLINEWDSNYENCKTTLFTISEQPYDPTAAKTELTLASVWVGDDTIRSVIAFNRSHSDCRIVVKDYSEYNTEDDYSAGITKLNTEIIAGNAPDIIDVSSLSYKALAERGLLLDLYPLLDADEELKREDFFPNVLAAVESNGKLYSTVTSFYVQTCVGASSVVGAQQGWNYKQFDAALASMPEGCEPFDAWTVRDDMLYNLLAMDMDSYVDWSTGKCSFDSEQFIQLLEFCAQFPESFDWDNYEYSGGDDSMTRISQGRQMLLQAYISSFDDVPYYDYYFGGSSTYIGYPTENGVGHVMGLDGTRFAISAGCKSPAVAWDFVRSYFTEEYQNGMYGFPANMNSFNKKLTEAMTVEYQKDENGNYLLDENGEKIPVSHGGFWFEGADGPVELYATTQEQADAVMELIRNTTKCYSENTEVSNIVKQEAQAFFEGQKSATDVAKLIQSKVSIYINEQL